MTLPQRPSDPFLFPIYSLFLQLSRHYHGRTDATPDRVPAVLGPPQLYAPYLSIPTLKQVKVVMEAANGQYRRLTQRGEIVVGMRVHTTKLRPRL
jgi:hypothetical protein